jgi:MscS family membrane protein
LFSRKTLDAIPDLYEEVNAVPVESIIPAFLVTTQIARIPLYAWLALVGLPLFYWLTILLDRTLRPLAGRLRRRLRKKPDLPDPKVLPAPIRLLLLAGSIRWMLSKTSLPLLARQLWSYTANVLIVAACVWLFILLHGWVEDYVRRRLESRNLTGAFSFLHLVRRTADVLAIFVGILVGLRLFGVNITAALAGLGLGGVAVALAAQKTLENVIAGISLIFDRAVNVGDTLSLNGTVGAVTDIGMRSTRIRTLDRTVLSIPNGQIANASLEILGIQDKFWLHHFLSLRYETSASQMRSFLDGFSALLTHHPLIESNSIRVRFLRFSPGSLDVEVFAYLFARDWNHFLEVQEQLLLQAMDMVQAAGTKLALPSQATYLVTPPASNGVSVESLVQALPPDQESAKATATVHSA